MKKLIALALCTIALLGCNLAVDGHKYDGLILVDPNTGIRYQLKHQNADAYFIYKEVIIIDGKDTTKAFR